MSGSLVKKFKKFVFRESGAGAGTSFELGVPDEATIGQLYILYFCKYSEAGLYE